MKIFTRIKLLLLSLIVLASASSLSAQVSITLASLGQNISVDKAVGGSSEGYTNIGTFTIEDQAAGQFAVGSNRKIYLAPSAGHWKIDPTSGTGLSFGGTNITAASMLVSSNLIEITYTVVGTNAQDNFISVTGISVQSNTTMREAAAVLRRVNGPNNGNITGFSNGASVAPLSEEIGAFTKLQVLLPGEAAAPGTLTGKIGTPTDRTAGTQFGVTVRAVDAYWNLVNTATDQINVTSNDAGATHPANNPLVGGTRNFNITPRTLGTINITATDVTDGSKTLAAGSATVVSGGFTRLQLLLPGETAAPGTPTGKTGTPDPQVAGTPFTVTVSAVDAAWNPVAGITDMIHLVTTDANATMPADMAMVNGVATFTSVTLVTGGNRTITASNVTNGTKTANTSPNVMVTAGAFTKLLLLLPGETAAPGTPTGKGGTLTDRTAGTQFGVTVRAVDAYWNLVNTATDQINVTSNDAGATHPANNTLVGGTRNFNITLRTLGTINITATDVTDGSKTLAAGSATVVSGGFTRLQLLLPGETAAPGTPTGKTGTPDPQVAGTPFTVTVNAVDAAWNPVAGITDMIHLATTDVNATMPADVAMVNGVATFTANVTLVTGGNRTITASNVSDNSKTANTSPNVAVGAGAYAKLIVRLPGETLVPGTALGKTGTPAPVNAGATVVVSVFAVDDYGNIVPGNADIITISSTDGNATLPANNTLAANGTRNFNITLRTPGTVTVTATNTTNNTINGSSSIAINSTFTRLQLLLPGETAAPGTPTGKTGTPDPQVAGTPFTVTVNAVDAAWNPVAGITDVVHLTTTDANATMPADVAMVNGVATFTANVTLVTGGNRTITASNVSDNTKTANTSPNVMVTAGAFTKLQILLPGETATPGTLIGKTGALTDRTAGVQFSITVRAVDAYWNLVNTATDQINVISDDAGATHPANTTLVGGTRNFNITLRTLGTINITATDVTDGSKTLATGSATVVSGGFTRLQVLLPGEVAAPGTLTGKTGTPDPQVAGTPFTVTVNAVDAAWNPVAGITDMIHLATTDANATMPADVAMVNGVATFTSVTLVTGGNRTITASNVSDNTKTANTSPNVMVGAGVYAKLIVRLPGEVLAPGTALGKTGTPTPVNAGATVVASVFSVDGYGNIVPGNADIIAISSTDGNATLPPNNTLAANGTRNFNITLRTPGTVTVTAINTANNAINGSSSITVNSAFTKLQLLLPGETAAPGTPTGKTGTPTARVAGTPFTVTVNAVDAAWNPVAGITDVVHLVTTDANATMPADVAMVNGVATFTANVTLVTGGNRTITASNVSDNTKTANTSPNVMVTAGAYAKLQVILPGETAAPGTGLGKTGPAAAISSGTAISIRVNAVDAYWNVVASNTHSITLTTNDANGTMPATANLLNGTRNFTGVTLRTIGAATITATNNTVAGNLVSNVNVVAGAFVRLQLLLPGEVAAPGTPTGKTGSPNPQVAGVAFPITVNAVDASWNVITSINDPVNFTATNDAYAQLPIGAVLGSGTLITNVTYRIGNTTVNRRLTATHATATSSQSPVFRVDVGAYARLVIILPGETFTAGHPDGKVGPAGNQGVGAAFQITVRATDIAFNQVVGPTDQVQITSTDPIFSSVPATGALSVATGQRTFNVNLGTASNSNTLTAAVFPGPSPILPYITSGIVVLNPSNSSDLFRSVVATGNWNNSTSWESFTGGVWQPSTLVPAIASTGITVRSGNTINVTAALAIDDVTIENGGQVTLTTGNLTVNNGAAATDFLVAGILRVNNGRTITTTGALQFAANGKYQHAYTTTSGTLPTANWVDGSTCEIVGYTNFAGDVLGSNQTFSDFIWNVPQSSTASPSLLNGFTAKNLTVTRTGTNGWLNLSAIGGTTTITGNYTQTAGNVRVNKTSGTQSLLLGGNFAVNAGTFALGAGTVNVTFNGSSAQSISNAGAGIVFQNIAFFGTGTKTLTSGSFSLGTTGVLTMNSNTILDANGNLTVLSDASSSGRIAPIPASSSIAGNVTVQRFITGGTQNPYRTYRMFSSPVYDNGNSGNRTYSFNQFIDNLIITGPGGSTNGFDPVPGNPTNAWTYVGGSGFVPIPNINTTLPIGKGSYIFFTGNRSNIPGKTVPPFVNPESVTMDFKGTLNQQDVTVALNNGTLVGNPYASSIDWNSVGITKNNLFNNIIRIWNPQSRSYATYNGDTGVPDGAISNIIPAGQGFFVQANGSGSLTFTESAKVNSQPATLLMSAPIAQDLVIEKSMGGRASVMAAPTTFAVNALPRTELRLSLLNNGLPYKEETAVIFQTGKSAQYNATEDATYLYDAAAKEQKLFLSSLSADNTNLTINYMPEITTGSNVKLNLLSLNASGDYQLEIKYKNLSTDYLVKVNDSYLHTSTLVQNGGLYSFSIDKTKAASYGANRLSVSFEPSTTLPVAYASFTVAKVNQGVSVKWNTLTETNNNRFEIERAGDDQVFVRIHTEQAKGSNSNYSYLDKNPLQGNNYYRLMQFDDSGKGKPTKPQVINYSGEVSATPTVSVYPNPVRANFTVKYNGVLTESQQTFKVVNTTGQVLLTKLVTKAELLSGHEINIANYPTGVYVVEVYENGTRIGQVKLAKQ